MRVYRTVALLPEIVQLFARDSEVGERGPFGTTRAPCYPGRVYRGLDPRARCQDAHAQAHASFQALAEMRGRVLPLVARALAHGGGDAPMIPDYAPLEPYPHGAPEAMLESYTKRYLDLAAYYASENRRLAAYVDGAVAGLREVDAPQPLGPAPRPVPFSYVLAETMRGYWLVLRWALFPPLTMVFVGFVSVTSMFHPLTSLGLLAPLAIYAAVRAKNRLAILRGGEVPEIVARTVTFGSGKMSNWPMTFTRGWRTEVRAYSGAGRVTHFQYRTSRGTFGTTSVSGVEYDGVIVCHPDKPELAFGVPDFGSMPRPDARGQWDPSLPFRAWAATLLAFFFVSAWIVGSFALMFYEMHMFDLP